MKRSDSNSLSKRNSSRLNGSPFLNRAKNPCNLTWKIDPCLGTKTKILDGLIKFFSSQTLRDFINADIARDFDNIANIQKSVRVVIMNGFAVFQNKGSSFTVEFLI